jgi:hypothetical protein
MRVVVVSAVFRCIEIVLCLEYKDFLPLFTSTSSFFDAGRRIGGCEVGK